jgi:hypothetical protein
MPSVRLTPREPPLAAVGVVATGAAIAALKAAARRAIAGGADLKAASGEAHLVVLGAFEQLPWADGCVYVGRDGPLLVPTTKRIEPAADLVAAALDAPLIVVLEDAILTGPRPVRTAAL